MMMKGWCSSSLSSTKEKIVPDKIIVTLRFKGKEWKKKIDQWKCKKKHQKWVFPIVLLHDVAHDGVDDD